MQSADAPRWKAHRRKMAAGYFDGTAADPVYSEPVHACPPEGSGVMPCCGRTPFEVPLTDRMTSTERVTCAGVTSPTPTTDKRNDEETP